MRKSTVYSFVLLAILSFSLALVPKASSQPENVKVLSYSWYVDSIGLFDVVGEVQNVGPNTIESVLLGGKVYTNDGVLQVTSTPTLAFVNCLIPQQKAAFYMDFPSTSSVNGGKGDLSWLSIGIDRVEFTVVDANVTSNYRYPFVTVKNSSGAADGEGVYWVSGTVQNSGTETATDIRVIGTFYNATGTVVAVGYTEYLTPASLSPSSETSFKVGAFDQNQTIVPSTQKISSYSLLVQVKTPLLSGTPPAVQPYYSSSYSNSTSTTPPSDGVSSLTIAPETLYVVVIAIIILGLAGITLVLKRRKSKAKSQTIISPKLQTRKKKR